MKGVKASWNHDTRRTLEKDMFNIFASTVFSNGVTGAS